MICPLQSAHLAEWSQIMGPTEEFLSSAIIIAKTGSTSQQWKWYFVSCWCNLESLDERP